MRCLNRNKSVIYYALYKGEEEAVDSNSLYTGVIIPTYENPVEIRAVVSAARGTTDIDLFGVNTPYTKSVIVDDTKCPIDEHSRLWVNCSPTDENGIDVPHNYEVVQVAKSFNHITYAIREVDFAFAPIASA